ncbi:MULTISPECIES: type II secretion system minor pseudopilin GspK [unclassified Variovorax]|uniref:type II secretion system minor pseudopilin GspK n=1 Tax=unclassified Variovorax TaxID=663243 RepID=UPI000D13B344|nr:MULTISPECIES: type II secretion system minor pseudopilin GspK [unclassified Variovorax]AVQ81939.1 general secretion pathway protein GspK [Variovorax sp. PMC12]QRY33803.1 type II secretion system minor pseudopilin GspK [Variovorax sp. PDNC026]
MSTTTRRNQSGAALLAAMLTVMLVATFAAAALWQQWRASEVEGAERARVQAAWVLIGALDWSRLILSEDGRAGGPDHLGEPWAVPLEEARLTSFLSAEKNVASDNLEGLPDAFLSGRIVDAQSKLNVLSLVDGGKPVPASVATFTRLFNLLGLPLSELNRMTAGLAGALASDSGADGSGAPLMPQEVSQLVWLGLSPSTAAALEPYVTILPVRTTLNINTASAEAISASMESLSIANARQLVERRTRAFFKDLAAANAALPSGGAPFNAAQHGVGTQFFEVYGKLRLDRTWVEEHSLLQRNGVTVTTVWRTRGAGATNSPVKP